MRARQAARPVALWRRRAPRDRLARAARGASSGSCAESSVGLLRPVDAHHDRGDVDAGAVLAHAHQRLAAAVPEDGVVRVARSSVRPVAVRGPCGRPHRSPSRGSLDCLAGRRVDHDGAEQERPTRPALGNVATDILARDVVGPSVCSGVSTHVTAPDATPAGPAPATAGTAVAAWRTSGPVVGRVSRAAGRCQRYAYSRSRLGRSMNASTRAHASSEAEANSSWRRSKKLCGAPSYVTSS